MNKKSFTTEEKKILLQNPYTYKVTDYTLSFTKPFNALFIEKYKEGITPRKILSDHGYDPEMLGDRRIWGISQHLREEYVQSGGDLLEPPVGIADIISPEILLLSYLKKKK